MEGAYERTKAAKVFLEPMMPALDAGPKLGGDRGGAQLELAAHGTGVRRVTCL